MDYHECQRLQRQKSAKKAEQQKKAAQQKNQKRLKPLAFENYESLQERNKRIRKEKEKSMDYQLSAPIIIGQQIEWPSQVNSAAMKVATEA